MNIGALRISVTVLPQIFTKVCFSSSDFLHRSGVIYRDMKVKIEQFNEIIKF